MQELPGVYSMSTGIPSAPAELSGMNRDKAKVYEVSVTTSGV